MSLAEGVSARVSWKQYATGVIDSNSQPSSVSDPGMTGGQILRRVSSSLKLAKDTYQSAEVRSDRQIADFRHGTKRVTGGVSGEFSPGTYWDFLEAVLRATDAAAVTATEADFTDVTADATASTFTFSAGDPVDKGFRIGDILRFTNLSETANNTKNFFVTAFGGTSNRTVTVYPAPTSMGADIAFSIAATRSVYMPASNLVSRKFAFEHWFEDVDIAELFTECRLEGFNIQLPASGLSMIDFSVMGRDMEVYSDSNSPFFASPTAAGTTGILAAVNGRLIVNGSAVGLVTGLNIQAALSASSDPVVGQNYVPEVILGRLNITGQVTVFLEDATFINYFKNETEVGILAYLTASNADAAAAVSVYLPRVKFGDADTPLNGEGGQIITMPYQALKYATAGSGIEATTLRICDTEAA